MFICDILTSCSSPQSGPKASLYLTLVGILAGFLSTFWNFGYTRIARKMQAYLDAPPGMQPQKVKKQQASGSEAACAAARASVEATAALETSTHAALNGPDTHSSLETLLHPCATNALGLSSLTAAPPHGCVPTPPLTP